MRQDLPDFEHGKPRKNPKRKAPDTAAAVASEESEPKRRIVQEHDMSKSTTIDNPQPEPVEEELPYMPDRFLFYFLKPASCPVEFMPD